MIVADSDVLIDFLRGRGAADVVGQCLTEGSLHTTVVARFELLAGSRSGRDEAAIRSLLDSMGLLVLDEAAADRAATLRRILEDQGRSIGMADSLVAGIVLANAGTLLTRNLRHFERVEGLVLHERVG